MGSKHLKLTIASLNVCRPLFCPTLLTIYQKQSWLSIMPTLFLVLSLEYLPFESVIFITLINTLGVFMSQLGNLPLDPIPSNGDPSFIAF